ncbi:MAG: hypothetical protein LBS19_08605 [Clostridiales bacterium]|jgi:hypothetical protein|nr:hypothetical protein [Clostridiales bacterium]
MSTTIFLQNSNWSMLVYVAICHYMVYTSYEGDGALEACYVLSLVADIVGVLSFIGTIAIWLKSNALSRQIAAQKETYMKEQSKIKQTLMGLRDNIWRDDLLELRITSQIRTELYTFNQNYSRIFSFKDKRCMRQCRADDGLMLLTQKIKIFASALRAA